METLIMRLSHRLFGSRSEKMPKVWGCFLEMPAEWRHRWLELIETLDVKIRTEPRDAKYDISLSADYHFGKYVVSKGNMQVLVCSDWTSDTGYNICLSIAPRTSLSLAKEIEEVFLKNGCKPLSGSLKELDRYVSD